MLIQPIDIAMVGLVVFECCVGGDIMIAKLKQLFVQNGHVGPVMQVIIHMAE
jgi:hypothetical protein